MTMKLLGALLVAAAGAMLGGARLWQLKARLGLLQGMDSALAVISCETESLLTPLPDIFASLAEKGDGRVKGFFASLADESEDELLEERWRKAVFALDTGGEEGEVLLSLGRILGRCGAERQTAEIEKARRRLAGIREGLGAEIAGRGKSLVPLGASAGAMLAILLL